MRLLNQIQRRVSLDYSVRAVAERRRVAGTWDKGKFGRGTKLVLFESTMSSRSLTCFWTTLRLCLGREERSRQFPLCLEPKGKTAHKFGVGLKRTSIEKAIF
jgi:hypothetical protein